MTPKQILNQAIPSEIIEKVDTVFAGKVITVKKAQITLPSAKSSEREMVFHSGGAAIIALNAQNEIALVTQYRICAESQLLELPAGKRDGAEPFLACAQRELSEETGFSANKWQLITQMMPSPGYSNEVLAIYLATDLAQGLAHPDPDEYLSVSWHSLDEAVQACFDGNIVDAKTIVGILAVKQILNREVRK